MASNRGIALINAKSIGYILRKTDHAKRPVVPQFSQEIRAILTKGKEQMSLEATKNNGHIQGKSGASG
jgi:hypothetical protein